MKRIIYALGVLFLLGSALPTAVVAEESVTRAQFTSAIDNREPVDDISEFNIDSGKVYFFSELRGLEGQTITHRWEYQGQVMAEVNFNVGGPRWRVNSSKNLMPAWTGEWQVVIVNQAGEVLATKSLKVIKAAMESSAMNGMDHSDMESSEMNGMDHSDMGDTNMQGMDDPAM